MRCGVGFAPNIKTVEWDMNHEIAAIEPSSSLRRGASPEAATFGMSSGGDASEGFDLGAILTTLLQAAPRILATGLAVAIVVGAALLTVPSVYTASAQLQLLRPNEAAIGIANVAEATPLIPEDVISEISIISSPRVLYAVSQRLGLSRFEEFVPQSSMVGSLRSGIRGMLTGETSDAAEIESDPDAAAAGILAEATRVTQLGLSSVVELSVSSRDPDRAAAIANAITVAYLTIAVEDKRAEGDAAIRWFEDRLVDLGRQIDRAGADVAVASAEMAAFGGADTGVITRQITDLSTQLIGLRAQAAVATTDQDRADAARRIADVDARVAELKSRLLDQTTRAADLRARTQHLEALQLVSQTFQTRLTEVRERASFQQPNARVVTAAEPPAFPSGPRRAQLTVLAFLFGAVLASAFVLYRAWRADGVNTVGQLARLTALPVLAELPKPGGREAERQAREETAHLLSALLSVRRGALAADHPGAVIAVLSALPGEGSGRLAMRLALAASPRARVVLLRADPDAPVDKGQTDPIGIDVLRIEEIGAPRDVMTAAMPALEVLANRYDLIVVDAPPVLAASEATLIARRADAAVLVVQWNRTPQGAIRKALQKLAELGAAPAAAALVDVDSRVAAAFGYPGETIARRRLRAIWRRNRPRPDNAQG